MPYIIPCWYNTRGKALGLLQFNYSDCQLLWYMLWLSTSPLSARRSSITAWRVWLINSWWKLWRMLSQSAFKRVRQTSLISLSAHRVSIVRQKTIYIKKKWSVGRHVELHRRCSRRSEKIWRFCQNKKSQKQRKKGRKISVGRMTRLGGHPCN